MSSGGDEGFEDDVGGRRSWHGCADDRSEMSRQRRRTRRGASGGFFMDGQQREFTRGPVYKAFYVSRHIFMYHLAFHRQVLAISQDAISAPIHYTTHDACPVREIYCSTEPTASSDQLKHDTHG